MTHLEIYKPITNFAASSYVEAAEFIRKKIEGNIAKLRLIEDKHSQLQTTFDIFHPNITFTIDGFSFDKEAQRFTYSNDLHIKNNGNIVSFYPVGNALEARSENVLFLERPEDGATYLDNSFLNKNIGSHKVYWRYVKQSILDLMNGGYILDPDDIPSFGIVNSKYWRKVEEHFPALNASASDINNNNTIVNKFVAELLYNNRQDLDVYINANAIQGDSFYFKRGAVSLFNAVSLQALSLFATDSFIVEEDTPVTTSYASGNLLLKDLSNAKTFMVPEKPLEDRGSKELISKNNLYNKLSKRMNASTQSIDDDFTIESSYGDMAISFRYLQNMLHEYVSEFYMEQLKMFAGGYSGGGPLGELIAEIDKLIREIESSYVIMDVCAVMPIDSKDESCEYDCDSPEEVEAKLMVTKQRLIAQISCDFLC